MRRLPSRVIAALDASGVVGIRAGREHRFIGVWPIVVDGRLFVRSWTQKPNGWYHAFKEDPRGWIEIGKRRLAVRARPARGARLNEAIDKAYAAKYDTPGSKKYVVGFKRSKRRRGTTTEFVPR